MACLAGGKSAADMLHVQVFGGITHHAALPRRAEPGSLRRPGVAAIDIYVMAFEAEMIRRSCVIPRAAVPWRPQHRPVVAAVGALGHGSQRAGVVVVRMAVRTAQGAGRGESPYERTGVVTTGTAVGAAGDNHVKVVLSGRHYRVVGGVVGVELLGLVGKGGIVWSTVRLHRR